MWSYLSHNFATNCRLWGLVCRLLRWTSPTALSQPGGIVRSFFAGGNSTGKASISTLAVGLLKATTATTTPTGSGNHSETATLSDPSSRSRLWRSVSRWFRCDTLQWASQPGDCTLVTLSALTRAGLLWSPRTKVRQFLVLTAILSFALSFSGCATTSILPPPMEN